MPKWSLNYQPNAKQSVLHAVRARQVMYGGAAGGGKSHALRMDGLIACLENPGLQAYLFRRTYPELKDNHLIPIQQMAIPPEVATWKETDRKLTFYNDSFLQFCFAEDQADIFKYQGAEMHWLGVDEGALFLPDQLKFLRTRVRLGRWQPTQQDMFPRIVIGSNPGGPAHNFLREVFIEQAPPMHVFYDRTTATKRSKGWKSVYIPARMDDNPYLDVENYEGTFTALSAERAKALRDGDWDVVAGAALSMLERGRHMVRHFKPPRHWTHVMAMDWGTAKPFSVGWYTISEGAVLASKDGFPEVHLPKGAVIRFAEWYGWSGEADTGCRMSSGEVAREILKLEQEMELPPIDLRIADPQMWASQDGPSPQQNMRVATNGRIILKQGRRDRKANYTEIVNRLVGERSDDGKTVPMFYVTANCRHFWRTVPGLVLDTMEPDKGPATRTQEDHCFAAGTLVDTLERGPVPIEYLIPGCHVVTPLGYAKVLACGMTGTHQEVWMVQAEGRTIIATPNHRMLTHRGWLTIEELTLNDMLVEQEVSSCPHSISMVKRIGFAASIGSAVASDFTAWFGSIITGLFREDTTSTIRTGTEATTTSPILSLSTAQNTCRATCGNRSEESTLTERSRLPEKLLALGMAVKKAANGIRNAAKQTARFLLDLPMYAKSAVRASWRSNVDRASAQAYANVKTSAVSIQSITPYGVANVYNLRVETVPVFTIEGGLVTHNCYDETTLLLSAFLRVTTEQDRYNDEMRELAEQHGGVARDPYAVRRRR